MICAMQLAVKHTDDLHTYIHIHGSHMHVQTHIHMQAHMYIHKKYIHTQSNTNARPSTLICTCTWKMHACMHRARMHACICVYICMYYVRLLVCMACTRTTSNLHAAKLQASSILRQQKIRNNRKPPSPKPSTPKRSSPGLPRLGFRAVGLGLES